MTTGGTEEKPDGRALTPVSGSGLLARYGDLVLLYAAPDGDDERTAEVLDAIASAAGGDGRRLGRRLASLLLTAGNQDQDFPPLAAFGPVGDGVAVIVHGAAQVSVVTDDGEIILDGRDALTWVDRMIPAPARVIRGALDTLGGTSNDPWSRLDAGVVRAGGFVFGEPSAVAAAPATAGPPVAPVAAPVPSLAAVPPRPETAGFDSTPSEAARSEAARSEAAPFEGAPGELGAPEFRAARSEPSRFDAPGSEPSGSEPSWSEASPFDESRPEASRSEESPFQAPDSGPAGSGGVDSEAAHSEAAHSEAAPFGTPSSEPTPLRSVPDPTEALPPVPPSLVAVPSEVDEDELPQHTEAFDPFRDDSAARPLPPSALDGPEPPDPSRGAASVQRGGYEPPAPFSAPRVPTFDDPDFSGSSYGDAPRPPSFDNAPSSAPPAPPGPPPAPFDGPAPPPPPPYGELPPPAPFGEQAPPPPPPGAYADRPAPPPPFDGAPPAPFDGGAPGGPVHVPTGPASMLPDDQAVQPSSAPPAPQPAGGFDPAAPFEAVLLIGDQAEVEDRSQTSGPLPPADVQPPPGPVPADGAEEADARPIVLGIYCKNDHFNDPRVPYCAVCGISMAQLTHVSRTGPRPPLGLLVLDDGATFRLDTDYVVGREPERDDAVLQGRARALRIDDPKGVVSRIHARIELDGWDVNVVDLASANGTHIAPPNSESWTRLEAHRKVTLTPGTRVVFGRRGFRYESHRNP